MTPKTNFTGMALEALSAGRREKVEEWLSYARAIVQRYEADGNAARADHWRAVCEGIQEALDDNADRD